MADIKDAECNNEKKQEAQLKVVNDKSFQAFEISSDTITDYDGLPLVLSKKERKRRYQLLRRKQRQQKLLNEVLYSQKISKEIMLSQPCDNFDNDSVRIDEQNHEKKLKIIDDNEFQLVLSRKNRRKIFQLYLKNVVAPLSRLLSSQSSRFSVQE